MTNRFDTAEVGDEETRETGTVRTLPSYTWKSAYGVLAAMVLTIPLGIGFFLYEGIFALLSDAGGLLVGVLLAPLVWGMYLLNEGDRLNRGVFGIGVISVAGICLGSFGLVAGYLLALNPELYGTVFLGVQFLGWILLGLWLLGVGVLGRRTGTIGKRTSWTALLAGIGAAGGMVTLVYSYAVGSSTPLFPLFMGLFVVGFLLWAFLFGRELRARRVQSSPSTTTDSEGTRL